MAARRRAVMSEINVTPMVDVMLVLLIIFMVSAPLLTVGVPIDLPQSQAKSLSQNTDPLTITIDGQGPDLPAGGQGHRRRTAKEIAGRHRDPRRVFGADLL